MADKEIQRTLDEHQRCMKVLTEVEECLRLHGNAPADWCAELAGCLRKLESALKAHFGGEEEGMFRLMPLEYPRFAARLKRLEEEHPKMIESLQAAIRKAEGPLTDVATRPVRELKTEVQLLIATLRRHEAEENELVMTAQWTAIGASD